MYVYIYFILFEPKDVCFRNGDLIKVEQLKHHAISEDSILCHVASRRPAYNIRTTMLYCPNALSSGIDHTCIGLSGKEIYIHIVDLRCLL
jgi:hypothetical protein